MRTIIYRRVSTREQGNSGLGLDAQLAKCSGEVAERGWTESSVVTEVASAASRQRPELARAMRLLDLGHADVLMVSRLDRLSRSVGEFAGILDRAQREGWKVVVLDPAVDMSDPFGRMMAQVAMAFAELERHLVSMRTKEGLAALAERGVTKNGLPWESGRFSDQGTIDRIVRWHLEGKSNNEIARTLQASGVPTARGGKWDHKMVKIILDRQETPV